MEVLMQVFEPTIILRILVAALLGFALGLEREITNKYAGLRTNILVCLGACVFTILSIYAFPTVLTDEHANGLRDTARVAAQVVTGIGFIGGGTVLRHGATVFGLTPLSLVQWLLVMAASLCILPAGWAWRRMRRARCFKGRRRCSPVRGSIG